MTGEGRRRFEVIRSLGEMMFGEHWAIPYSRALVEGGFAKTPESARAALSAWRRGKTAPTEAFVEVVLDMARSHANRAPEILETCQDYESGRLPEAA